MYHNPFVRYENTETKRMQVVFLREHLKLSVEEISAITGYAVSTVKKYSRKFLNLLKVAKKFFIQAKNSIIETVNFLYDGLIANVIFSNSMMKTMKFFFQKLVQLQGQ